MPCFYLNPEQDDFNKIPELQVCIAEALYDAEAVLSNPSAFKPEEIRILRDQVTSNLERAWEITGRRTRAGGSGLHSCVFPNAAMCIRQPPFTSFPSKPKGLG
jgi:hypothetical protein